MRLTRRLPACRYEAKRSQASSIPVCTAIHQNLEFLQRFQADIPTCQRESDQQFLFLNIDERNEGDTTRRIVMTLEPTHIPFIPFIYVQKQASVLSDVNCILCRVAKSREIRDRHAFQTTEKRVSPGFHSVYWLFRCHLDCGYLAAIVTHYTRQNSACVQARRASIFPSHYLHHRPISVSYTHSVAAMPR